MTLPSNRRILLEVPIASVEDALAAEKGGADRLELNAAFSLGGLTPSLGMLLEAKAAVALPLLVMLRPRPGGFAYGEADFRAMLRDAEIFLANGADGLVCGVLAADGRVDRQRCRRLVDLAGPKPVVFHRAFDVVPDPFEALDVLVDLGFRRILTSGQEETAARGSTLLAELARRAAGRIEILPAAGINRLTVAEVVARTGCDQVHASLRENREDRSTAARPHIVFGALKQSEDRYDATSAAAVAELRGLLDRRSP